MDTDSGNPLAQWLEKPILSPEEFGSQMQAFIQRYIPPLEVPDTADKWIEKSQELRRRILDEIVFRGVPADWYEGKPSIVWVGEIDMGKGYAIRKLRYEALPDLWIPALLYEPMGSEEKIPAALNVNGHVGPPGKTEGYEQVRCINLAKRGMLALHPEWLVFGELQGDDYKHNRLAYLDLCGVRGLSVFFLAIQRGIDLLEMHPRTDPERIAMTGLSGGGWQTIILSSLDTRISAVTPNAGYIGLDYRTQFREDIGDLEQNPSDLLTIADYSHLTAMLAPRSTLLIYNEEDNCCFKSYRAHPSVYEPVVPFFELFGNADGFQYYENSDPGTHNYDKDNRERFYRFINRCFLPKTEWIDAEIPSDDEVLGYDDLVVGIPENNANFHTLANGFLSELPRSPAPEESSASLDDWQTAGRERLREVLRLPSMTAKATVVDNTSNGDLEAVWYRLDMNGGPGIPAIAVFHRANGAGPVAVTFADKGRASLAPSLQELLESHSVVVAVDPLYTGESISPGCPVSQCAMMVGTIGERPLGIQVAQIGAVIQWTRETFQVDHISLHGTGWNASVMALCACALNNDDVDHVVVKNALPSLKHLVTDHVDYEECPALFCFGLAEQFDIPELVKLCLPVEAEMSME